MSEIQNYVDRLYSSSADDLAPVHTARGFSDADTLLGKRQTSDVGSRLVPPIPSYSANSSFSTNALKTINYQNTAFLPEEVNTYADSKIDLTRNLTNYDFTGQAKSLISGYSDFKTARDTRLSTQQINTDINTDPTQGGAAGTIDGVNVDMNEVTLTPDGGTTGGGGISGGEDNAAAAAATILGEGIETIADDADPTSWNAGEVTGSLLKGAGKGAALGASIGTMFL